MIRSWSTICQPIRHQDSSYFGLELLGVFRVVYYVIFSYFCLSMNLESFGTFWDQLGFISMECQHRGSERQPIDRGIPAERSVQQMRIQQSQRRSDATRRLFKRSNFVEAQIRDVKISLDFENISGTFWKPITYQIEERRKSFPTTYHTRNFDQ